MELDTVVGHAMVQHYDSSDHSIQVARQWHLSLVRGLSRKVAAREAATRVHIRYARHYGATWGEIAKVMGRKKKWVKKHYG